jgi:GxxExxY protein
MKDPVMDLCDIVRETSYSVHRYLRNGHLEKVYENCLVHRLVKKKVTLRQQYPIDVYDEDGTAIGHFVVDLFVEDRLLVELKACSTLVPEHTAQVLGYLRACRLRHAMLINFGAAILQVKKLIL